MRIFKILVAIFTFLVFLGHNVYASTCDSVSLKLMEETWREFREIHPFGFQTVALKHQGANKDTCVFVISEPSPWVKAEELEKLFADYNGNLIIGRKEFGYDGGLYDAIGCAKLNSVEFISFEKNLFDILYGTAHKPYYTDLDNPSPHVYYSESKLNYNLYFAYWLNTSWWKEVFENPISEEVPFRILLDQPFSNDLIYSKKRGFVIWEINPNQIILDHHFRENARRFALDTDFVLAAIRKNNIFIIGREREIPVTVLPPLRSETIFLLASLNAQEFSVNINSDSDSFVEVGVWAKQVLMSEKLRDTELGNLLTLTGIQLLSLSNHANVRDLFIDYPLPPNLEFLTELSHKSTNSIKCQWELPVIFREIPTNPSSSMDTSIESAIFLPGERTPYGTYDLVVLDKTGSLKPSYLNIDGKTLNRTEGGRINAYDYFTSLNNTDLVRVAQYAMMFQAFQLVRREERVDLPLRLFDVNKSWVQTPSQVVLNKSWCSFNYSNCE